MLADVVTCIAVGSALGPLGWWGMRNARALVPPQLPEPEREKRVRVMRRGAVTAQCLAIVFALAGIMLALI
ncbi:hypothetical protein SAMN06265360_12241 [Haloechinothrix alba]|uniref:Uncharacterized protein n=1 Tax=Haloechinothrix alba TaxID=664784 RepID=A0A238ZL32_9PSEU|nr:hypothetical protein SAMN06265360_12241 [Haloechinothrix alba]